MTNEQNRVEEENEASRGAVQERENAWLRKQKERALMKQKEIQLGIQNLNGTKQKVKNIFLSNSTGEHIKKLL